jgi:hypothetical protein
MAVLLEVTNPVLRFTSGFLERTPNRVVRVYARAFLASGLETLEPWEHGTPYTIEDTKASISEAVIEVVKESDDAEGVATAKINKLKYRSFGAEITNIDEASVSALLCKTAVVELWLATGEVADAKVDFHIGCARLPLRAALGTNQLCADITVALSSSCVSQTIDPSAPILLDAGRSSKVNLCLSASNKLFSFIVGGRVLTFGNGHIENVPVEWMTATTSPSNEIELAISLQQRTELIGANRVVNPLSAVVGPHATISGGVLKQLDRSSAEHRNKDTVTPSDVCRLEWTTDLYLPVALVVTAKTLLDVALHPNNWVFVLELQQHGATEARATALSPVDALMGSAMVEASFFATKADVGQEAFAAVQFSQERSTNSARELTIATATVAIECSINGSTIISGSTSDTWIGTNSAEELIHHFGLSDCVAPRRPSWKRTHVDAHAELHQEVNKILASILIKHDSLQNQDCATTSSSERMHREVKTGLRQSTAFHTFRLGLTPCLQRVVRKWHPTQPTNIATEEAAISECYMRIMDLVTLFQEDAESERSSRKCGLARAHDAAINSLWGVAATEHKTRLSLAMVESSNQTAIASAWFDLAKSVLLSCDANSNTGPRTTYRQLSVAKHALSECLACGNTDSRDAAVRLQGAVLLEEGKLDDSEAIFAARTLSSTSAIDAAILCVIADMREDGLEAKCAAACAADATEVSPNPGVLRAISALHDVSNYFIIFGLTKSAASALTIADRALVLAYKRNRMLASWVGSPHIKAQRRVLHARLSIDTNIAVQLGHAAVRACKTIFTLTALGDLLCMVNDVAGAVKPFADALVRHTERFPQAKAPFDLCVKHARCLLRTNQNFAARDAYVAVAKGLQDASLWLGAGTAALRLGELTSTDRYLRIATIRSPHSAQPYGLLMLSHLTCDGKGTCCVGNLLDVSLNFGLNDPGLLRELGNACFQLGHFSVAEALLRRAVAAEFNRGAHSHALKRLADVRAARVVAREATFQIASTVGLTTGVSI